MQQRIKSGTPTIASDEDMDRIFVLADEHAPTGEAALAVLRRECQPQWGVKLGVDDDEIGEPYQRAFKWSGDEDMVVCDADDPAKDSEWWCFDTIAPGDWETAP